MSKFKAVLVLLAVTVLLIDHVTDAKPWWGRRRRRCHTPTTGGRSWANNWDRPVHFRCSYGRSVSQVVGLYSSCHKDRVWYYACRGNPATRGRCHWSHYVNNWDQMVNYHCPYSGFITGVQSYHHNSYEDRRFRFRCCRRHHYKRYHCINTHYVNNWRGYINFHVPYGYYLSGVTSVHDNGQEDRKWQFEYCKQTRV